jgi:hypothetical protein
VLKNGLSRMRGDSHVRFLGGGGAAMRCCYPTSFTVLTERNSLSGAGDFGESGGFGKSRMRWNPVA